jgi:hypothetical protein
MIWENKSNQIWFDYNQCWNQVSQYKIKSRNIILTLYKSYINYVNKIEKKSWVKVN